jgi:hypothetical protein
MTTKKQREAARRNIKKARKVWQEMSSQARSRRQPEGRERAKPGAGEGGDYYRVVVRDKSQFTSFRTQDVGRSGHTKRLAGRRSSGSWGTQAWLIHKDDAHSSRGRLVADDPKVADIFEQLRGPILHVKGDVFRARPRRNVPEKDKPTPAQRRARKANIEKAQKAHASR